MWNNEIYKCGMCDIFMKLTIRNSDVEEIGRFDDLGESVGKIVVVKNYMYKGGGMVLPRVNMGVLSPSRKGFKTSGPYFNVCENDEAVAYCRKARDDIHSLFGHSAVLEVAFFNYIIHRSTFDGLPRLFQVVSSSAERSIREYMSSIGGEPVAWRECVRVN